jgi:erythromycin esterase
VDPESVATAAQVFEVLGSFPLNEQYGAASADIKRTTATGLNALLAQFDEHKQDYIRKSSQMDWLMARQHLVIVKQAEVKLGNQYEVGRAFRDRAMAENAKWILEQEPPGTKMMLWAHNGHVATAAPLDAPEQLPMGAHLREIFGGRYVSLGFALGEGSFRAVDMVTKKVRDFTVGPPPRGSLDATLAAVGAPLFAIDLRLAPTGVVTDWFAQPHVSRQIGGGYSDMTPGVWMRKMHAASRFDLLMFVAKTTPSR